MNDLRQLEERLRSWKPRSPAPRFEKRLFSARRRKGGGGWTVWNLPAPALASLLLFFSIMGPSQLSQKGQQVKNWPSLALSNLPSAAYSPDDFCCGQNYILQNLEWPGNEGSTSKLDFLGFVTTNRSTH